MKKWSQRRKTALVGLCGALCVSGLMLGVAGNEPQAYAERSVSSTDLLEYADVKSDDWYASSLMWAVGRGIVSGYEEAGRRWLKPEQTVTEAEFTAMLLRFYSNTSDTVARLEQPEASVDWSDVYYRTALLYGLPVAGAVQQQLRNTPIARGQVARMIASAFGHAYSVDGSVLFLYEKGLSEGRSGKTVAGFEPDARLSRAEAVRFLELLEQKGFRGRLKSPAPEADDPAPGRNSEQLNRLAIFYGTPSLVNGAKGDVEKAVQAFGPFELIILGDGVEHPDYWDYAVSSKVVMKLAEQGKKVFGYVDLGVATTNSSNAMMEKAVDEWKALGASGIYLDNAGYDFAVTRERQSHMVDYIHKNGLRVFMGAWNPDDVNGDLDEAGNPSPSRVREGDWYLSESWLIGAGRYMPIDEWQMKAAKSVYYQETKGIRTAVVSTTAANAAMEEDGLSAQFAFVWWAAAMYGFPFQWTDYHFSATTDKLFDYKELGTIPGAAGLVKPINVSPHQTLLRANDGGTITIHGDGKSYGNGERLSPADSHTSAINIDGTFADWSDIPVYADSGQGSLKLQRTESGIKLAALNVRPGAKTQLFLRVGGPSQQGLKVAHWSGYESDFLIEGNRLYRYTGVGTDWQWSLLRTLDASSYAKDGAGTSFELSLSGAELGLEPGEPYLLQAAYIGDDRTDTMIPAQDRLIPYFLIR